MRAASIGQRFPQSFSDCPDLSDLHAHRRSNFAMIRTLALVVRFGNTAHVAFATLDTGERELRSIDRLARAAALPPVAVPDRMQPGIVMTTHEASYESGQHCCFNLHEPLGR